MTNVPKSGLVPLPLVLEFTRVDEPQDPHAFRFEPQGYTLRTPGGGRQRFEISWGQELISDLEAIRMPGRDPAIVQRVGEVMRQALVPIGWDGLCEQLREASEAGRRVVVTLRSNAAELYVLPWELLTVGASGQHLGELPGVLLRHEWPATSTTAESPSPRPEGGRVLLAWSAAGGAVPAAEHLHAILSSYTEAHVQFDPQRDVRAHASVASIADALADATAEGKPFAVLHLLCHGQRTGSSFGLVLNGEDSAANVVDAGRLRQLLAPHAKTLRLVVLAACDSGNSGDLGNHLGSVAQTLHRAGVQSIVASRYPLSVEGSIVLTEALYRALLVDLCPLEHAVTDARTLLARNEQHLDWVNLQLYAREADGDDTRPVVFRPYRGLLSFEAQHRRFFWGRDAECRETLGDLQALIDGGKPRFLVVVGASGTGKSSIVLAGVVPLVEQLKARRPGRWEVAKMAPGTDPVVTLRKLLDARPNRELPLLLVVDQFEELFTHTATPSVRETFARELWSLAKADTGIHCIVTLRVDYLGRCGELVLDDSGVSLDRIAYDEIHRIFVARMAVDQLRVAIERPAARVGMSFAPGLVERILADVGSEPGALPLLQYALDRLWLCRRERTLSAEVYEEFGGLVGALRQEADSVVASLDAQQLKHARRLLTRLVGLAEDEGESTRRRVELAQLEPADQQARAVFVRALERLVEARLVVRNEKGGAPTIEIAHEALIRKWEQLRVWIQEDRIRLTEVDKLKEWVGEWTLHHTLLSGAQLGFACDIVRRYDADIDDSIRKLVRASEARRRRQRIIVGVLITAFVWGFLSLIVVGFVAEKQRRLAQKRLGAANTVVEKILFEVLPKLDYIAGTAPVQKEIHGYLEDLQRTILPEAGDDARSLRNRMAQHDRRGNLALTHDDLTLARQEFKDALNIAEQLAERDPTRITARGDLSVSLGKLGNLEIRAGNLEAARALLDRSLAIREALAAADPTSASAQRGFSVSLSNLGVVEDFAGRYAEARALFARSLKLNETLAAADPTDTAAQRDLFVALSQLGEEEIRTGNLATARVYLDRALKVCETLAARDPAGSLVQRDLSQSLNNLGRVEIEAGNLVAARRLFDRALKVREALAAVDSASAEVQRDLSISLEDLGRVEMEAGNLVSAYRFFDRALKVREALAAADPTSALAAFDVVLVHRRFIELAVRENRPEARHAHVQAASALLVEMERRGQVSGFIDRELVQAELQKIQAEFDAPRGPPE